MFKCGTRRRYSLSSVIAFSLLINGLMCPSVSATDRKPIVISFGQPNIFRSTRRVQAMKKWPKPGGV